MAAGSDRSDWGPMARAVCLSVEACAPHRRGTGRPRESGAFRETPRSTHGLWERPADRPDPIALLEEQAVEPCRRTCPYPVWADVRLAVHVLPGAALIMAADLAVTPRSGVTVQLCGDAHLSNFGVFGTPERQMVFDVNDFDETLPGPWEWDVKRLAASFEVGGRDRGFRGGRSAGDCDGGGQRISTADAPIGGDANP